MFKRGAVLKIVLIIGIILLVIFFFAFLFLWAFIKGANYRKVVSKEERGALERELLPKGN